MKKTEKSARQLLPSMKKLLVLFVTIMLCFSVMAQEKAVTGTVTDASGMALPGVNVVLKGTQTGAITDANGKYSIKITGEKPVLTFSFIGYITQEIEIGSQTLVNAELKEEVKQMDEVVVVGYGTMKKKLNTGANAHVSSDEMDQKHALRLEQSLQGLSSGIQITSNSGQPGDGFKVRIRGTGSINNSDPLYIVDGVPTSDISYIDPVNVESMDILKDAASAAIYGARAANGVVLITTKKGKAGEMHVSYDGYYGVQNVAREYDMLNSKEYATITNEANYNAATDKSKVKYPFIMSNADSTYTNRAFTAMALDTLANTNWQDYLYRKNAPIQSHTISIEGGTEKSIFSASLNYFHQDGIVGNSSQSSYERISARFNSEHKVYKNIFKYGENLTLTEVTSHGVGTGNIYDNSVRGFLNVSPIFKAYDNRYADDYGESPYFGSSDENPVAAMYYKNQSINKNYKALGDAYAELEPIKGLKIKSDIGIDLSFTEYDQYTPVYALSSLDINSSTKAEQNMARYYTYNWENTVNYSFNHDKHSFSFLVGNTVNEYSSFNVGGTGFDLTITGLNYAILDNGTNHTTWTNYGSKSSDALLSYFGRANYNFNEMFLLSAVYRRDGSTKFGADNRWGNFYSFAGGVVLTQLDGIKEATVNWLDYLKIRGSWGQNGNSNIPSYEYVSTVNYTDKNYFFGSGDTKYIGAASDQVPNAKLKWETAEQLDFGFDAHVLKHLTVAFDWYNKTQKDWLITEPVAEDVGILSTSDYPIVNGGDVRNRGVELALGYQKKLGEVSFNVDGNISHNVNDVLNVPTANGIINGETSVWYNGSEEMYRTQDGHPIGFFYGYKTAGVFQNQAEIDSYTHKNADGTITEIQPTAIPGDAKFVDVNGDGKIDANDKTQIGNPYPKFTYGLSFGAEYKGFDLSATLQGSQGNDVAYCIKDMTRTTYNWPSFILGRWTGEGTSNTLPRVTSTNAPNYLKFSDIWIKDGSYLKIRSINLGYDFGKTLIKGKVRQFRLYVSVVNAFTFTKYPGAEPEVGYGDYNSTRTSNMSSGIDLGTYPQARQYLLGLNVKF